ncbi:MAG: hypothetical protein KF709_12695 [Gemmatimonadaceae bacterium]|nr:hypothetical protein [Gemmatimonadaceae bacterium]
MPIPNSGKVSEILDGSAIDRRSFRPAGWHFAVLPVGLQLDERTRLVLGAAAQSGQSTVAYVFGCRSEFEDQPSLEIGDLSDLERISFSTVLGHIDTAVVAASSRWAALCSPEGFALIGAEAEVIDQLEEAWGGRTALRAEVITGVDENLIGWGAPIRHLMQHLFGQVGWPLHPGWP